MIKRILAALDNTQMADKVMIQALEIAKLYQAQLYAISVIDYSILTEIDTTWHSAGMTDALFKWAGSFQEMLDKCQQMALEQNIEFYQSMPNGNPAAEIIKYAEKNDIDLIVMGHISKTATVGFLFGSVSQKVSTHSKCSVMIIK
jgi:nucleotide-binding universal stress UspA family protein